MKVTLLGAVYAITAFKYKSSHHDRDSTTEGIRTTLLPHEVEFKRGGQDYLGIVHTGRLIRPGGHLSPGQKLVTKISFNTSSAKIRKLRLNVYLIGVTDSGVNSELTDQGQTTKPVRRCRIVTNMGESLTCLKYKASIHGFLTKKLLDRPYIGVTFLKLKRHPPLMAVRYWFKDSPSSWQKDTGEAISTYLRVRGFTTSAEYDLAS